ncbi:bifunctional hydroxymethylpyrimidine kinase/phosphomethylpyrimidine kinase [Zhihengliuella flava]|uniref:Hydroxymethylpyrimidine kinase/phosphomethylpyrimidine kinase n=1 Tax=Zhihengliuella flava TaxID=1285193 RepID=A0A931DDC8_9MICC|nr:bifunctional hydroxymethylpyrimidine kinase/phosphomethylpyrimidine kinase [Zhihengliuella flava]MBG6084758.1 hydroxymethylpyrimidine kinase/phosphomethylpyrimidine kinase [Zhihengliuella flava]
MDSMTPTVPARQRAGTPNILSIAGSDPSGGAGIQADLKSIAACGGYGMAALTALTAQNTRGVLAVHTPPAEFLTHQLDALTADVRIDAVKIGMLPDAATIAAVSAWLRANPCPAVVLDPVMVASSGDRLTEDDAVAALRTLLPVAAVITPNLPELAVLLGEDTATTWDAALDQARRLAAEHGTLVLAKGGHLPEGDGAGGCPDALVGPDGVVLELSGERVETANTHGTGCSFSSALATLYARHGDWAGALQLAKRWLTGALRAADDLTVGGGRGPVHHLGQLWSGESLPDPRAELDHWWELIGQLRADIDDVWFVRQLADGTLDRADFEHYLAQDSIYLTTYSKALARAAQLAPTLDEQEFWANSAHECLAVEMELHQSRLADGGNPTADAISPETRSYLNHLLAATATGSYAQIAAAVLPCYWLYQDIGTRLAAAHHPDHPYADWLGMYSSPEFDAATRRAIDITQRAARQATEDEREAMLDAFLESARQEMAFFAQRRTAAAELKLGV